jgi:integrase
MKLKISYYLKSGTHKMIPVIALISFGYSELDVKKKKMVYKPIRYYTPIKLKARSEWDYGENLPVSKELQRELSLFERKVENTHKLLELKKQSITPTSFKTALDIEFGKIKLVDPLRIRMTDYIEDEIMTSGKFKPQTLKRYRTTINNIKDFEKKTGRPLYAGDVNEDIYRIYTEFIRGKVEKNNSLVSYLTYFNSTLSKIARSFKIPLFKASRDLDKDEKLRRTIEEKVFLSFDDIKTLMAHTPQTAKMQNVKLIFLTLLFTGCRFGDVFKIKPEYEYQKSNEHFYFCKFITQKNQKEVLIPIVKPLLDAFKRNKGTPKIVNLYEFDKMVKILVKDCGIIHKTSLSYTDSNGVKKMTTAPFYELVTSHTGRRSFITNLINYVPITTLCKITTHELKDKSIIFIYDKTSLLQNAVLFLRHLIRARLDFKNSFPIRLI